MTKTSANASREVVGEERFVPLYFFDVEERIVDQEGIDLPDLASAEAYAAGLASTFPGSERCQRFVVVRDATGKVLDKSGAPHSGSGAAETGHSGL